MPSGEIVEIDAADNDVAILDASACCALASSSSSSSSSSSPSVDDSSDACSPRASQSQEDHDGGGGGEGEGEDRGGVVDGGGGDREADDDDRGRVRRPAQVSPMPQQKKASAVITPRPVRKGRGAGGAPAEKKKSKKSSTCGGGGGEKLPPPPSSSSSSSSAKMGRRKAEGEGGPATPPSGSSSSSAAAAVVAVATPGGEVEDDGSVATTTKRRKKDGTTTAAKKPSMTLHSFFARVDPSAAPAAVESRDGKDPPRGVVEKGRPTAIAKVSAAGARAGATAIEAAAAVSADDDAVGGGGGGERTSAGNAARGAGGVPIGGEAAPTAKKGKKASAEKKKPAAPGRDGNDDGKSNDEKKTQAAEKKSAIEDTINDDEVDEEKKKNKKKGASSRGGGGVEKKAQKKGTNVDANENAAEAGATSARRRHAPLAPASSSSSSTSSRVAVGGVEEEIDDSPMYALAVASRTFGGAGGSRSRRGCGGNSNGDSGVLARQWDERLDLLARYKLEHGDCAMPHSYKTTAAEGGDGGSGETMVLLGRWLENQKASHRRGKLLPQRYERLSALGVVFGEETKSSGNDVEVDPDAIDENIVYPARDAFDAVEASEGEADVGGTSMMGADDGDAIEVSDDVIIDVNREEGKDSVPVATAPDSEDKLNENEDDDDDDATVAFEEAGADSSGNSKDESSVRVDEDSNIPCEIDQPPTTADNGAVFIAGVSKKSVQKEPPTETSVMETSIDEVEDVAAPKETAERSTRQMKTSTKLSAKSRKKAGTSPKKSFKNKASAASAASATETTAVSPNAASLKKLSACPQKKVCKTKTHESPSATVSVSSCPINVAISLNNLIDATEYALSSSITPNIANLTEEDASRLHDYKTLRAKYVLRAIELGNLPSSEDYEEECLSLDACSVDKRSVEVAEDGGFPDKLLTHLQLLVQGRSQPLSVIAKYALDELSPFITDVRPLTLESISSKIKLLAQRKSYLSGKPPASERASPVAKLDCFENAEECYMWRWELSSLDLLPQGEANKVKKARTMRKKLQGHHKAIINLITTIDKASLWIQNSASTSISAPAPAAGETLTAKVSDMEEKVLKFEREEEKARLLRKSKLLSKNTEDLAEKQREKQRQEEEKRDEKKRLEEERRKEKKRKEEEKELKKAEVTRLKNEEKEKKRQEVEEKESKRKARMMSFFSKGSVKKKAKVSNANVLSNTVQANIQLFDSDAFRKLIDSRNDHDITNPFAKLSPRSKASRRWKTNKVRASVFVTVLSENAFAPQPYDEERIIIVPNRYKFLGFHEDVRPPYRGTWSKRSSLVTGRRPLGRDTKFLDYDIDSEEEWEEGDDDEGEDLVDGDDGADEEEDMQNDEDNDGWLADEDDLGIEDDDDETRELRKKNNSNVAHGPSGKPSHFKACVVAPRIGGLPYESFKDDDIQCFIEGFSPQDAMDALISLAGCVITPDVSVCLDAFPPSDSMKDANQTKKDSSGKSSTPLIKDLTPEAQKIMAHFVHNSTLKSKDYVVTELLKAHPTITNSRAQAMRELDVIADKRRLANGPGVLWEVKSDHLKKLGLKEEDLKNAPEEAHPSKLSEGGDKTKKKRDPNAPKQNMSAFILYCNAVRNEFRAANPNVPFGDVGKLLSANFKALTAEERATWDDKAATDKARYHKEMAEYSSKVPSPESKVESPVSKAAAPSCSPKPSSAKKRKNVSAASANLLAAFISQKKKQKSGN